MRSVKADKAFLLVALGLVFGVILPLLVVGAKTGIVVFKVGDGRMMMAGLG